MWDPKSLTTLLVAIIILICNFENVQGAITSNGLRPNFEAFEARSFANINKKSSVLTSESTTFLVSEYYTERASVTSLTPIDETSKNSTGEMIKYFSFLDTDNIVTTIRFNGTECKLATYIEEFESLESVFPTSSSDYLGKRATLLGPTRLLDYFYTLKTSSTPEESYWRGGYCLKRVYNIYNDAGKSLASNRIYTLKTSSDENGEPVPDIPKSYNLEIDNQLFNLDYYMFESRTWTQYSRQFNLPHGRRCSNLLPRKYKLQIEVPPSYAEKIVHKSTVTMTDSHDLTTLLDLTFSSELRALRMEHDPTKTTIVDLNNMIVYHQHTLMSETPRCTALMLPPNVGKQFYGPTLKIDELLLGSNYQEEFSFVGHEIIDDSVNTIYERYLTLDTSNKQSSIPWIAIYTNGRHHERNYHVLAYVNGYATKQQLTHLRRLVLIERDTKTDNEQQVLRFDFVRMTTEALNRQPLSSFDVSKCVDANGRKLNVDLTVRLTCDNSSTSDAAVAIGRLSESQMRHTLVLATIHGMTKQFNIPRAHLALREIKQLQSIHEGVHDHMVSLTITDSPLLFTRISNVGTGLAMETLRAPHGVDVERVSLHDCLLAGASDNVQFVGYCPQATDSYGVSRPTICSGGKSVTMSSDPAKAECAYYSLDRSLVDFDDTHNQAPMITFVSNVLAQLAQPGTYPHTLGQLTLHVAKLMNPMNVIVSSVDLHEPGDRFGLKFADRIRIAGHDDILFQHTGSRTASIPSALSLTELECGHWCTMHSSCQSYTYCRYVNRPNECTLTTMTMDALQSIVKEARDQYQKSDLDNPVEPEQFDWITGATNSRLVAHPKCDTHAKSYKSQYVASTEQVPIMMTTKSKLPSVIVVESLNHCAKLCSETESMHCTAFAYSESSLSPLCSLEPSKLVDSFYSVASNDKAKKDVSFATIYTRTYLSRFTLVTTNDALVMIDDSLDVRESCAVKCWHLTECLEFRLQQMEDFSIKCQIIEQSTQETQSKLPGQLFQKLTAQSIPTDHQEGPSRSSEQTNYSAIEISVFGVLCLVCFFVGGFIHRTVSERGNSPNNEQLGRPKSVNFEL